MIEANRIVLKLRGPQAPSIEFGATPSLDVWLAANDQLRDWSKNLAKKTDEIEYEITFLDGKQLAGLITVERGSKPDLAVHLRELINSKAGDPLPDWVPSFLTGLLLMTKSGKEKRYSQLKYCYRIGPSDRPKASR